MARRRINPPGRGEDGDVEPERCELSHHIAVGAGARLAIGTVPNTTVGARMTMDFHDEQGLRWTVQPRCAIERDGPSHTTLIFTSESGEHRTSEAWLPAGASWDGVEERTWCAILRYADAAAARERG